MSVLWMCSSAPAFAAPPLPEPEIPADAGTAEMRGSFVPTIISPDRIGLVGGDFTELGFRYRWATE